MVNMVIMGIEADKKTQHLLVKECTSYKALGAVERWRDGVSALSCQCAVESVECHAQVFGLTGKIGMS